MRFRTRTSHPIWVLKPGSDSVLLHSVWLIALTGVNVLIAVPPTPAAVGANPHADPVGADRVHEVPVVVRCRGREHDRGRVDPNLELCVGRCRAEPQTARARDRDREAVRAAWVRTSD